MEAIVLFVPGYFTEQSPLPKSINAAIRQLQQTEQHAQFVWKGFLSQQGGDCKHWRRRYFELAGSRMIAYHETSRRKKATINLMNAICVSDGEREEQEGGGREQDEAMYMEEGFRKHFRNGETVDFNAEDGAQKDECIKTLHSLVGKISEPCLWAEMVLEQEGRWRESEHERIRSKNRELNEDTRQFETRVDGG